MPVLSWMKNKDKDNNDEVIIKLPDEDQKKINDAAAAAAELPAIKEKLSGLDKITEFITAFKTEQDAEKVKKTQQQQQQQQQQTDEDFEALMLTDPKAAISKATQPLQVAILTQRADNIRREVFEDQDKFKFYTGDIKREIDTLLAGQALAARNDPSVVENCYHTVVGKHTSELIEGKLKSRFAGSESGVARGTSTGSAGGTGTGETVKSFETLQDKEDIKKLAKVFGLTPEKYREQLDEQGIGYA